MSSDHNHYLYPKTNHNSTSLTLTNSTWNHKSNSSIVDPNLKGTNISSGSVNLTDGATISSNISASSNDSATRSIVDPNLKGTNVSSGSVNLTDGATISSNISASSNDSATKVKEEKCDIFDGRWVYDPERSPIYNVQQCPFLSEQVSCRKNGRPDSDYEHWRWQPRHCDIPRFNSTHMLEKMRGKRVAIIGDSLNRIQWESLTCLIFPSLRYGRVRYKPDKLLKALDYDFSLEFYWSPFLVKVEQMKNGSKVLQLDKLDQTKKLKKADVLVFNTGHWWTHRGRFKTWDFYKLSGKLVKEMDEYSAFEMAMKTWAYWVEKTVNFKKTTVFFRSISPEHKTENMHWCYNQTQIITNETYTKSFPASMVSTVEETIKNMKAPVKYLNITHLSEYRRDAHTSVYTVRQAKLLTDSERKQPELYADCSHWCLPGVPDTWNALIYASILENLF